MLFFNLIPLVAFIFQGILLIIVLRVRIKSPVHWAFSSFLGTMALWGLLISGLRNSPTLAIAQVWEEFLLPVLVLSSYSFLVFAILFTRRPLNRATIVFISVPVGILLAISPTSLVLRGMQVRPYGYAPILGPLWAIWIGAIYIALFISFYFLYRFYRTAPTADDRNRALYVLGGIAATFLGGTSDYVAALGIIPHPGGIYGNIVFATLATIAVVRHKLVDAHFYLRRGLAYILVGATVVMPYAVLILILDRLFGIRQIPLVADIVLILSIAIGLHFLLRRYQEIVDRWFIGARYSALQTLREFSRTATQTLDSKELHTSLIHILASAMGTNTVHLFLYAPGRDSHLRLAISSHLDPKIYPIFKDDNPLVKWLKTSDIVLYREDLAIVAPLQGLSKNLRQNITELDGEVFIPLKTQEHTVGLLVLGQRSSRIPYGQEDVNLLVTVSSQAAMAIENARLYSVEKARVAELQNITDMKTSFLMTVAHQLKTPLAAVKASAGMLQEVIGEQATSSQKRLLSNVERGTMSLETEIVKLLEFLKLRTSSVQLTLETLDIRNITKDTIKQVLPSLKSKDQSLILHMPDDPVWARLDGSKVESILLNLIGNASKFTPKNGKIEIRLDEADSFITIEVSDNGPGILPEKLEHLFESFYEIKDVGTGGPGSSGLGLAIAKSLVELHGGKIWATSILGKGSQFYFSLPSRLI
ncbi:MAG: histidine kinase [Candidatus Brocadiaceae bacterium]|nr:histidine kinase [Dehalococcoidia bacterium]MBM2834803.1 histidine kinase [Candidatus Brocadiaceae bacterium]